ncbi:MAG: type II secretion system F family protein [Planctomycetes bacterium]|nr:type II secretion system F family protein [Planctomycetota bacterium]
MLTSSLNISIAPLAVIDPLALAACGLTGGAVAALLWWVLSALASDDVAQEDEWRYDVSRINALRRGDVIYRLLQPVVQFFAKLNRAAVPTRLPEIGRQIQAAGLSRYWLAEEYLARCQVISLLLLPVYLYFCIDWMGSVGAVSALMLAGLTVWLLRRRLAGLAERRLVEIKRRMPFVLDLLTLLMEAGSSFLQALKQTVIEFEGHPISTEFGRVLTDMNMGKARSEAFESMRRRLSDDEINSIIGTIIQSEELGTPLTGILRATADVLRVKRSQRAETIAGESAVNMLLPGVLVMAATVLIMLGPFVLNFLTSGFEL